MPIKPEPILIAAKRWLELLPYNGEARARTTFATVAKYGDLTTTQYEAAYEWLRATGLLADLGAASPPSHRVLMAAIETSDAPWLPNADEFDDDPGLLPEDVVIAAEALGVDLASAVGHVRSAWGKVDHALREEIGLAGELALVELVEGYTDAKVDHVAAWNDGLGYDIAVSGEGTVGHLEVKTTTRQHRLVVHLSRNEYRISQRDPAWVMVVLRLNSDDRTLLSVATVPTDWVARQVPRDDSEYGSWESCRLDVPTGVLVPGLSQLTKLFGDNMSELRHLLSWPTTL